MTSSRAGRHWLQASELQAKAVLLVRQVREPGRAVGVLAGCWQSRALVGDSVGGSAGWCGFGAECDWAWD